MEFVLKANGSQFVSVYDSVLWPVAWINRLTGFVCGCNNNCGCGFKFGLKIDFKQREHFGGNLCRL